ncbi:hypothetical protein BGW80DRAFT_1462439 [Lactifluus volemus]|nr:hypothetical protein BGW80DRAFT_1462439 [Lactifluus volemus]
MQEPFPALELLDLGVAVDSVGETTPTLPSTFLGAFAPRLRSLLLRGIPFPTLPKLLLSSNHLVCLSLLQIPHSGYISPEAMVACVSALNGLTYIFIGFESPVSRPDWRTRHPPPLTRIVLPALALFKFHGVSDYLEDLVARVDAPLLNKVHISLLNQLIFDIRQLPQFIGHAPILMSYEQAEMEFVSSRVMIKLFPSKGTSPTGFLRLGISCGVTVVDWQVFSMAQMCSQLSFLLSSTERLDIRGDSNQSGSTLQVDMDDTQWLELFQPFTAIRTLRISRELWPLITSALRGLGGESAMEVLPALDSLYLEEYQPFGSEKQDIEPFIAARQCSDHPVAVHRWVQ